MKRNNKGFTMAELLIVVAIIAVLIAIAMPIFTTELEKSREGTDESNIRSTYSACVARYLADADRIATNTTFGNNNPGAWMSGQDIHFNDGTVNLKQQVDDWQSPPDFPDALTVTDSGTPSKGGTAEIVGRLEGNGAVTWRIVYASANSSNPGGTTNP